MDNKSEVSWLLSPAEFLAFVKLENTNSGSGGSCGRGRQTQILFHVHHQLREKSAVGFGADLELMQLLNLFFFPITKRYPESLDSRTHRIESLKFLLRHSAHPSWIRPLYFYVGATWFCGNCHFWGNTRTVKNYPNRFLYCFPQWIRCNAD